MYGLVPAGTDSNEFAMRIHKPVELSRTTNPFTFSLLH